jgi:hypothetical protein
VDWQQVADGRVVLYPPAVQSPQVLGRSRPEQRLLARALERFVARDARGALEAWRAVHREPRSLVERTLVGWALAATGDPQATPVIDSIRATSTLEADALLALLQARQGRTAEAAITLETALVASRQDPWPSLSLVQGAMDLAVELAHQEPALAPRLFEALRAPFVLKMLDDQRVSAAVQLLSRMDPGPACAEFVRSVEPHVRWDHEWLSLRHRCYVATGDPGAGRAKEDLDTFLRREPEAFRVTVGGNPQ